MNQANGRWVALGAAIALALGVGQAWAGLVPGGGSAKSDCYIETEVTGLESATVEKGKKVTCVDGDPCDTGPCGDDACNFEVSACINQSDPNLPECTPPAGLDVAKASGKASGQKGKIEIGVPQLLEGSTCGAVLDLQANIKVKNSGKKKPGKAKLKLQAKGVKGTKPRKDKDSVQLICMPRETECPATTTTTTTVTTTTLAGFCGDGNVDAGEECDDGNVDPTDGCTNDCTICGNGTVTAPEECDDSNLTSGDGCDANCRTSGCGNGLIVPPETCDDGNTDDMDSCPSDCVVDPCDPTPLSDLTYDVTFAGSEAVAGMTVFIDYPEGKVSIPGSGGNVPAGIITDLPGFAFGQTNDLDHALIQAVVDSSAFPSGLLFRIHFETCADAPVPDPGDFICTVTAAGDENLNEIQGVTCAVSLTP